MTKRKSSMIGHDPLAWIDPDFDDDELEEAPKKAKAKKKTAKKKTAKKSADKEPHPLGIDVDEFLKGFEVVKDKVGKVVSDFYKKLFEDYPDLKPLFENTLDDVQEQKLANAIGLVVNNINDVEQLTSVLTALGKRHQGYGVTAEHYPAVANTLLAVLKQHGGRKWTKKIANNWEAVLNIGAEVMLSGYEEEVKEELAPELGVPDEVVVEQVIETEAEDETVLKLEEVQDISRVSELHSTIQSRMDVGELVVDVSGVTRIDASSLQCLYVAFRDAQKKGYSVKLIGESEAFSYSVKLLGMTELFDKAA